jgi:hypothetical protein
MHTFSWCGLENRHDLCKRSYERFIVDPKTNKIVYLGETVTCVCKKRGCKCYVPAAQRKTAAKPKKRKS